MPQLSRRGVLAGILGVGAAGGLATLKLNSNPHFLSIADIQARESTLAWSGKIKAFELIAQQRDIDLGGKIASTWAYGETLPGKTIRINKNDRVQFSFTNELLVPPACIGTDWPFVMIWTESQE